MSERPDRGWFVVNARDAQWGGGKRPDAELQLRRAARARRDRGWLD